MLQGNLSRKLLINCVFATVWVTGWGCRHPSPQSFTKAENAAARKIVGAGIPIAPIDGVDISRLKSSAAYRRQIAWEYVARLTAPVPLAVKGQWSGSQTLPLWRTWYEQGEILNAFDALYYGLPDDLARRRSPLCESDIQRTYEKLLNRNVEDYGFSTEDFDKKLGQLRGLPDVEGVPGTGVTMFSPAIPLHYLRNYQEMVDCEAREPSVLPPSGFSHSYCMSTEFPDGRGPDIRAELPKGLDQSHCATQVKTDFSRFGTSVAVKANWFSVLPESKLAVFDTSAGGLVRHLGTGEFVASELIDPNTIVFDRIYSMITHPRSAPAEGVPVALAAVHFAIKQFPDWLWVTLWWSNDPDKDFGEDRPDTITGTWKNYKMCVVVDFQDQKTSVDDNLRVEFPSLAAALDATFDNSIMNTGNSWCSNPFIERGKFNSRTNCIGCHQHAGTGLASHEIFSGDESRFPHSAREKIRRNFPADYLFSYDSAPDQIQHEISEIVHNRESGF